MQPSSKAKREFYGFVHRALGDVDVDNDGIPRRFGYATSWEAERSGSMGKRAATRKAMLGTADGKQGVARGWIGAAQFADRATTLIADKISEIELFGN